MKVLSLANAQEKHVIRGTWVSWNYEGVIASETSSSHTRYDRKNANQFPNAVRGALSIVSAATQTLLDVTNSGKLFCITCPYTLGLGTGRILRVTLDGVSHDIDIDYTNTASVGFNYGFGIGGYPTHRSAGEIWSGGWKYNNSLKVDLILPSAPVQLLNRDNNSFIQYLNEGQTTSQIIVDKV